MALGSGGVYDPKRKLTRRDSTDDIALARLITKLEIRRHDFGSAMRAIGDEQPLQGRAP